MVFPSRGSALHFSPCPSTFVTHMALLLLPVEGTQAQSAGHFCSSSDWEVSSAGEVELLQFRPPHSQNTTLNRRQEQEVPEAIASIQVQATRIDPWLFQPCSGFRVHVFMCMAPSAVSRSNISQKFSYLFSKYFLDIMSTPTQNVQHDR